MEEVIWDFVAALLLGKGVAVAVAAFVLGQVIKSAGMAPKRAIPAVCAVFGAGVCLALPGLFPGEAAPLRLLYGMVLGFAATGGYEACKNFKKFNKT